MVAIIFVDDNEGIATGLPKGSTIAASQQKNITSLELGVSVCEGGIEANCWRVPSRYVTCALISIRLFAIPHLGLRSVLWTEYLPFSIRHVTGVWNIEGALLALITLPTPA